MAERVAEAMSKVINSNAFINTCLIGCFSVLGLRSHNQQNLIESLEQDNSKISSINKSIKNTLWSWKQQLYSDASSPSSAVPLSRLKSIYGDVVSPPPPSSSDEVAQSSAKIVI